MDAEQLLLQACIRQWVGHAGAVTGIVHAVRGVTMSRLMLCGLMSGVILCSSAPVRADDAEDKAVAFVEKLGGKVGRDEKAPGKPVVTVSLFYNSPVSDAGLKE